MQTLFEVSFLLALLLPAAAVVDRVPDEAR
jgi:hypothetical protein